MWEISSAKLFVDGIRSAAIHESLQKQKVLPRRHHISDVHSHALQRHIWQCNSGTIVFPRSFAANKNVSVCRSAKLFAIRHRLTRAYICAFRPKADAEQNIVSLTTSRCKILSKVRPATEGAAKTSTKVTDWSFKLNKKFSSTLVRVQVPLLKKLSSSSSAAAEAASVAQTRIHLIDSAIVRVMKARKRIFHQDLVLEVTKHLSVCVLFMLLP